MAVLRPGAVVLLAVLAASACQDRPKPPPAADAAPKRAGPPAHAVEPILPLPPCSAGVPCTLTLKLTALRDYHVNEEYPFKFGADAQPGVEHEGTGAFTREDEKTGWLAVRFRAAKEGTVRITGTFRLSVCNDDECKIESAPVAVELPMGPPLLPHETFTLESKVLGETRRINVYLPPGYAESGAARFPLLVMPDGGVEEDFPHLTRTVDSAIRAGELAPIVVVGIENTERRRDMTGPTTVESDRKIAARVGGSAAFRAFIRDELLPEVGKRVRASGRTGLIGESLAGLFVVETFFVEPELFDVYVAVSPSLWWNDKALVRGAEAWLRAHKRVAATLWLTSAGDDDEAGDGAALAAALGAHAPKTLTWSYEPMPREKHATIYRAAAPIALRRVFPPKR
jgi:hypothetical protein